MMNIVNQNERVAMITRQIEGEEKARESRWKTSKAWKFNFASKNLSIFPSQKVLFWLHFERWKARERDYFDTFTVVNLAIFIVQIHMPCMHDIDYEVRYQHIENYCLTEVIN